ncbi:hypothetical protein ON010_g15234 [Phytophthora cinnamomi]|nr:hypothetical protein ON010_g15234 [Phytophthora cinnamomi]
MGPIYRKYQRTRFLLVLMTETSLGFQVRANASGKVVVSSVENASPAKRAGMKVGDICESYYKDRTDDDDDDQPWAIDTMQYLDRIAVPKTDARGVRDANFEKRLQGHDGCLRALSANDASKRKKVKKSLDSDEEEPEEEADSGERKQPSKSYAVVVALCEEMRRFAAGTDRRSTSEDPDMTNAVAHLEVLHKRVEATAMQRDKTAEGLKPEQMTAEHVDACLNLIETEQERRQKVAHQRHQDQTQQLEEILSQCSKNVNECGAAAKQATQNTEEMMVSVREKTEAFLNSASRENQSAVNRASDILRTAKTVEQACKEELTQAEQEYELAKKVSELFNQALVVVLDLQKMVAAGQYKQRAEEALAQYIGVLTRALRASFLASFLQQTQDLKELDDTNEEVNHLIRKHGSTRPTRQQYLESGIVDIQAGLEVLQRQRIQTMRTQWQLWHSKFADSRGESFAGGLLSGYPGYVDEEGRRPSRMGGNSQVV